MRAKYGWLAPRCENGERLYICYTSLETRPSPSSTHTCSVRVNYIFEGKRLREVGRRAGHCYKLHSLFNFLHYSFRILCTLCMYVDSNTMDAEDLVLAMAANLLCIKQA